MRNARVAIIGGAGHYDAEILSEKRFIHVRTPYGVVEDVCIGQCKGIPVAFINRHGTGHKVPPYLINYRANIFALKSLGVEKILAINAAGSTNIALKPGQLVFVDDFVDLTKSREGTFFEGENAGGVFHFDMTHPYCPNMRKILARNATEHDIAHKEQGILAVTEGPRFESAAEIRDFRRRGFDLVNMTSFPEVALAREAAMCYASICTVTNYCTGVSENRLREEEVYEIMNQNARNLSKLLSVTVKSLLEDDACECRKKGEPIRQILNTCML